LAVDAAGRIYVTDLGGTVPIYDAGGTPILTIMGLTTPTGVVIR
jgi:hypothetical protein